MKVSVIANTSCDEINDKELFTKLGGKLAGICYMPNNFEALDHEDAQKTLKRANTTKILIRFSPTTPTQEKPGTFFRPSNGALSAKDKSTIKRISGIV